MTSAQLLEPEVRTNAPTPSALVVRPLTCRIGAEIEGVDPTQDIDPAVAAELNQLLNKWKVIFFRGTEMSEGRFVEFAKTFGPILDYKYGRREGEYPMIGKVRSKSADGKSNNKGANYWHTDTSWMARPAKAAVLRGVTVPEVGGDTMWADGVAAYEGLSDEMKERIENLDVVHDPARISSTYFASKEEQERNKLRTRALRKDNPLVAHPIVRTHPETGERTLYLNSNLCSYIVGLPQEESDALLAELHAHYARPEFTCRFRWTPNAIAVWDQRQTQHYAVSDYPPGTPRELHRILIAHDDVPHR